MPLDPDVAAFVARANAAGGKPLELCSPAEARAGAWDWVNHVGPTEPVAAVRDTYVPGPTADLPVRIYTPAGAGPFPALVFFHGSGWVIANIDIADAPHRALANRTGCVVVAVNYQKAPEHKFPAPLDDAWAATRWVLEHAAELDVDPARVGVGGDSAGGNLAAAVCLRARDEQGGPVLAFQVLVYPATDFRLDRPSMLANGEGYGLTVAGMRWFWEHYLRGPADAEDPLACPLRAPDLSGLPAAVVVTAEFDPLRDEGEEYAERLHAAGVPVTARCYPGQIHGFLWMAGVAAGARRLLDDLGADVRALVTNATHPPATH